MKTTPREYPARVVRVIDGDTVDLDVDVGFRSTYRDRFRLNGLNAPEGKTAAGARLSDLLYTGREVVVTTYKPEKFGRWLADIAVPEVCSSVCEMLLAEGLAVKYDGGKR
jgi:micrococcal nuclease